MPSSKNQRQDLGMAETDTTEYFADIFRHYSGYQRWTLNLLNMTPAFSRSLRNPPTKMIRSVASERRRMATKLGAGPRETDMFRLHGRPPISKPIKCPNTGAVMSARDGRSDAMARRRVCDVVTFPCRVSMRQIAAAPASRTRGMFCSHGQATCIPQKHDVDQWSIRVVFRLIEYTANIAP